MTAVSESRNQKKIITIPNLLSLFRLCLIPVIVWAYCVRKNDICTALLLLLSAATDIADGIIARKFRMVSDFGKAFDPIADKLTQIAMLFCLVTRFPHMLIPLIVLSIKELSAGVLGLVTIRKTNTVMGAVWHGKVTTVLLYAMMTVHLVWPGIPAHGSDALIALCTAMMLISAVLYGIRNSNAIMAGGEHQ